MFGTVPDADDEEDDEEYAPQLKTRRNLVASDLISAIEKAQTQIQGKDNSSSESHDDDKDSSDDSDYIDNDDGNDNYDKNVDTDSNDAKEGNNGDVAIANGGGGYDEDDDLVDVEADQETIERNRDLWDVDSVIDLAEIEETSA